MMTFVAITRILLRLPSLQFCDRCLIVDSTNEYLHFCSKHLYHNKNQHSLHCKTVAKILSNFGSAADLSPSVESSSSSYDLNWHDTLVNKMASNQSLIDLTTNSNGIEIKNRLNCFDVSKCKKKYEMWHSLRCTMNYA